MDSGKVVVDGSIVVVLVASSTVVIVWLSIVVVVAGVGGAVVVGLGGLVVGVEVVMAVPVTTSVVSWPLRQCGLQNSRYSPGLVITGVT